MMQFNLLKKPIFPKFRAAWLYRRGMAQAKLHKNQLAIADYTAVIEMAEAQASIRAMALYNRALVYYCTSSESKAVDDLNKVLKMTGAAEHVRMEATRKLVRMKRASNRTDSS